MKKKTQIQNYFKDYRNRINEILNMVQIEKLVEIIEYCDYLSHDDIFLAIPKK